MVGDDFNRVVHELLAEQPGLARDKAEALADAIVGRPRATPAHPALSRRAIVDADVSPRCLALAIDGGCVAVLYLVVAGLIYIVSHLNPPFPSQLILPVVVLLYFLMCWGAFAATPGMYALDLRLVDDQRHRIGFSRAAVRLVALLVGCIPAGASFVSGVLSRTNRSWHDRIAGTHLISLRDSLG